MRADLGLGVDVPVMQSGMGGVAGPDLAAAVTNAGGLGTLAALRKSPDVIRDEIRQVRSLTDGLFGVNIWLHDDVRRPPDVDLVAADLVAAVQTVLNEFRPRLDLPVTTAPPPAWPDVVDGALEVMIGERIPVFSSGLGVPETSLVERFHLVGTKVVTMVATVDDAILAASNGVDVVVAQGSEAGGHRSFGTKVDADAAVGASLFSLLPEVIDGLGPSVPVIAAGGLADGRGIAAVLSLGACGALLGTRFVATVESMANAEWKRALMDDRTETTITDGYTGQWARVVATEFTARWEQSGALPPPGLLQLGLMRDLQQAAREAGDTDLQPLYAGTSVHLIEDLLPAAEVVERLRAEIRTATSPKPGDK